MSDLAGKVAAVTGAETGIGRAIALRCAADAAAVVAVGLLDAELASLDAAATAAGLGERLAVRHTDVRNRAAIDAMIDDATTRFGRLDAAVANAGVFVEQASITEWSRDEWDRVVAVNLTAVFETLQAAARVLVAQDEGGSLLATTSSNVLRPRPQALPYVASKGAAHQMVRRWQSNWPATVFG